MICFFWHGRVSWKFRVLIWIAYVGAIFGISYLAPQWGYYNDWAFLCFVPMLIMNLCFGTRGEKGLEKGWKFSAFLLTIAVFVFQPKTSFGYGMKLACSLVVSLTLIFSIFTHTLLQKCKFGGYLYDALYWLLILGAWAVAYFVEQPVLTVTIRLEEKTLFVPLEIILYIVSYLRMEPLYNIVERIVVGSSYKPIRGSSVKSDDRSCKNCAYYRIRQGYGYQTFPYCLEHQRDLGALEVYGKCPDYVRRR